MTDLWSYLSKTDKPLVLYGTGNGADKILDQLLLRGITVRGIFASSGFVRNRTFRGFPVEEYETLHARFPDMIVLVCFGTSRPEVLANIDRIARDHEVYAPDVPVYGDILFDAAYYDAHAEDLSIVRSILADDLSRETWDRVIRYKLTGDYTLLRGCEVPYEAVSGMIRLPDPARYIDLGAYNGDTISLYAKIFPQIREIVAVEPDKRNFQKLTETVRALFGRENEEEKSSSSIARSTIAEDGSGQSEEQRISSGDKTVSCVRALVSDHDGSASIPKNRGRGVHETCDGGNGEKLTAVSLVTLLRDQRADLIKLDVEGNERAAIEGGREILLRDRPALIVSCYHRNEDLFLLPLLIRRIVPDYRVYMRHHPHLLCWDTEFILV
ncbi:MAG: FkbM family methyltransferase [Clostridiales bacterium]|nr:FkbM family methyltransferase [Clostridiales bacterium]